MIDETTGAFKYVPNIDNRSAKNGTDQFTAIVTDGELGVIRVDDPNRVILVAKQLVTVPILRDPAKYNDDPIDKFLEPITSTLNAVSLAFALSAPEDGGLGAIAAAVIDFVVAGVSFTIDLTQLGFAVAQCRVFPVSCNHAEIDDESHDLALDLIGLIPGEKYVPGHKDLGDLLRHRSTVSSAHRLSVRPPVSVSSDASASSDMRSRLRPPSEAFTALIPGRAKRSGQSAVGIHRRGVRSAASASRHACSASRLSAASCMTRKREHRDRVRRRTSSCDTGVAPRRRARGERLP